MAKNLDIVLLADYYGEMLTENQRKFIEYYYSDDLSLSEIAENEGGSRQGAMDVIKRAEKELLKIEESLGIYNRNIAQTKIINELKNVSDDTEKVKSLLLELEKTF